MNNTLSITLPSGVKISGLTSEGQLVSILNELSNDNKTKNKTVEKKNKDVVKTKKKGKNKTHNIWTVSEQQFLENNVNASISFLSKSFLANRHTKAGISSRKHAELAKRRKLQKELSTTRTVPFEWNNNK